MAGVSLPDIGPGYYLFTFHSDGKGGQFQFQVAAAVPGKFTGTGEEFGGGYVTPLEQLRALAAGIAAGLTEANKPWWDNITLVGVETVPVGMVTLIDDQADTGGDRAAPDR